MTVNPPKSSPLRPEPDFVCGVLSIYDQVLPLLPGVNSVPAACPVFAGLVFWKATDFDVPDAFLVGVEADARFDFNFWQSLYIEPAFGFVSLGGK